MQEADLGERCCWDQDPPKVRTLALGPLPPMSQLLGTPSRAVSFLSHKYKWLPEQRPLSASVG